MTGSRSSPRAAQLAANLAAVRERIAAACRSAGRQPDEITLIAVTKTYPASDAALLAELGVADLGENRDQEAAPKASEVAALLAGSAATVRWHFVGQLQRNKCRSVSRYAAVVQSVDSVRLATALGSAARAALAAGERTSPIDVLVQVSIDGDIARGGAWLADDDAAPPPGDPADIGLPAVLSAVAADKALRLAGLMAVAPLDWSPDRAFALLRKVADRTRVAYPTATILSAGMSDDLENAVASGATQVRIGSALLGARGGLQ